MSNLSLCLDELKQRIKDPRYYVPVFGDFEPLIAQKMELMRSVFDTFVKAYGPLDARPVAVHHVPGRLEFLGKHTDYAGGPVLNMAASRGFISISSANGRDECVFHENSAEWCPFVLDLQTGAWRQIGDGDSHWVTYPQKTVQRMEQNFGLESQRGIDVAFGSDLPPASGMSSSSGLMIMTFLSLFAHGPLSTHPRFTVVGLNTNKLLLAHYLACCENGQSFVIGDDVLTGSAGVGTFGGSQDQTAIFTAKQGMLSVNWFCPPRWTLDVPWPENLAIVVGFSGFRAEKTQKAKDAFNRLASRAKAIPEAYNLSQGTSLRWAADLLDVENAEAVLSEVKDERFLDLNIVARYKSFFTESKVFIPLAVDALKTGRHDRLGEAINASHECSKAYLENISPEIDDLVRLARENGAFGASGFGAGFGGSAYAVVAESEAERFLYRWREAHLERHDPPHAPDFFRCVPVSCARTLFEDE